MPAGTQSTEELLALTDGKLEIRKGIYHWPGQVRPASCFYAKTPELLFPFAT